MRTARGRRSTAPRPPSSTQATGSTVADRLAGATRAVDALLERSTTTTRSFTNQQTDDERTGEPVRSTAGVFGDSSPLARAIEVNRCHAEALLVSEQMGDVILGPSGHDMAVQRALGFVRDTEEDRAREILSCAELIPRRVSQSTRALLSAMAAIGTRFGYPTALTYTSLCVAGLRDDAEVIRYARRIDDLIGRVVSRPSILQALAGGARQTGQDDFAHQLGLLIEIRDQIWRLKPKRVSTEFLLTQVLDNYAGSRDGAGDSLGLAVLDSILIGRLGFSSRFLGEDGIMRLEVDVAGRPVYWEVVDPVPLALIPVCRGRSVEYDELFALLYASLGTACFSQGRWDRSIEVYRRSLELRPNSANTHISIAACLLRKQQPAEALKSLEKALHIAPQSAEAYYHVGNAHAMMDHWPEAITAFKNAIERQPAYVEALNNLGLACMKTGDRTQALTAFLAALDARRDYYQAHFNLGNLYLEQQLYDDAIAAYRETCRLQPDYAPARYNMGRAYYEKRDLDGSISCYQKAVQINPKHFGAWHNLGIAYRDKGLVAKAVEALERAVTLNPCLMR